jgi:hypothetical protein
MSQRHTLLRDLGYLNNTFAKLTYEEQIEVAEKFNSITLIPTKPLPAFTAKWDKALNRVIDAYLTPALIFVTYDDYNGWRRHLGTTTTPTEYAGYGVRCCSGYQEAYAPIVGVKYEEK